MGFQRRRTAGGRDPKSWEAKKRKEHANAQGLAVRGKQSGGNSNNTLTGDKILPIIGAQVTAELKKP